MDAGPVRTAQMYVSLHAVARYCERILNIKVEKPSGINAQDLAQRYARAAGTTVEAIQELLYSPIVRQAIETKAPYFATGGIGFKVSSSGVIVTIVRPHVHKRSKLRILSDGENRHMRDRVDRRKHSKKHEGESP